MAQIKFFKGFESDLPALEKKINTWLMEPGLRVINVFGNLAPQSPPLEPKSGGLVTQSGYADSDVFIAILYEKV